MFDRFLLYARARRALKLGQFEVVVRLTEDAGIARERRAEGLRHKALRGMMRRAERRLADGNLAAALIDVEGVLCSTPEFDGAQTLKSDIQARAEEFHGQVQAAQQMRTEARSLAERGDLPEAERLCQEAAQMHPDSPEQAVVERFIAGRQQALADDLEAAKDALARGSLPTLRRQLKRLGGHSKAPAGFSELVAAATKCLAAEFARELKEHPESTLDEIAAARGTCPDLLATPVLHKALSRLAEDRAAQMRRELAAGRFDAALAIHRETHPILGDVGPTAAVQAGMSALAEALDAKSRGDLGRALETARDAGSRLDEKRIQAMVKELAAAAIEATKALSRSRDLATEGRLLAAREQLVHVLQTWPMHEPVRRQMEILDEQAKDREARLQQARNLAAEARLAAASALLLGLSSDSDEGREARLLLKDVNRRMDLAGEGLAQVRRAVHGQVSASREGLRHCVARLDEVAKLQADLPELTALREALEAEIRGLDQLESLRRAVAADDATSALNEITGFAEIRGRMLRTDRLDARFLEVADQILQKADSGLHNARLQGAAAWLSVARAGGDHPALKSRVEAIDGSIRSNQGRALSLLEKLESSASRGGLEDSSELLEEVRAIWADCPQLRKVEHSLLSQRCHTNAVDEVERLAGEGDVRGAHRKLGEMPPTPGFLRTRIFDIKQGLARAQGLDQGFLLRVDEGGEYLVLREDSLTIGNVREGKADLLVLANISGRHARIRRTLSFHGGMEDRIVAEKGEVFVNGRRVDSHTLQSGDRVRLGTTLEFVYRVPSRRSLTAALFLKSGFHVGGTDKILLMKDRGRDGRILIGRADDAHIRVPHDEAEAEVYSSTDGQIRVRFGGKGEMNGKPFTGEHPVAAGSLVRCGGTNFILQPWQRDH